MDKTSSGLLQRAGQGEKEAWDKLVHLYAPFLVHMVKASNVPADAVDDIVQETFVALLRVLPDFAYNRQKGFFRGFLCTVCSHKVIDWQRRQHRTVPYDVAGHGGVDEELKRITEDHDKYLVRRALEITQADFGEKKWKACWETVAKGRPAAEVGAELGMSPNAVYVNKSRVIAHLKRELAGLLDDG